MNFVLIVNKYKLLRKSEIWEDWDCLFFLPINNVPVIDKVKGERFFLVN